MLSPCKSHVVSSTTRIIVPCFMILVLTTLSTNFLRVDIRLTGLWFPSYILKILALHWLFSRFLIWRLILVTTYIFSLDKQFIFELLRTLGCLPSRSVTCCLLQFNAMNISVGLPLHIEVWFVYLEHRNAYTTLYPLSQWPCPQIMLCVCMFLSCLSSKEIRVLYG